MSGLAAPFSAILGMLGNRSSNLTSFINSVMDSATSIYNTYQTNKANRNLAEYSYGKDLEQWQREIEYNSPLNQMKRYQEAGLNPNLIYSQGNPGNSSVTSPSYKAPNLSYAYRSPRFATTFDINSILGMYNNIRSVDAEVGLKRAQAATQESMSADFAASAALKAKQAAKTKYDLELARKMEQNALKIQEAQLSKHQSDAAVAKSESARKLAQIEWRKSAGSYKYDYVDFLERLMLAGVSAAISGGVSMANLKKMLDFKKLKDNPSVFFDLNPFDLVGEPY